jgi:glutaredoxin-like protein NrdH
LSGIRLLFRNAHGFPHGTGSAVKETIFYVDRSRRVVYDMISGREHPPGNRLSRGEQPMIDGIEFTTEEGTRADHDVTVYALSTCGFCKRALAHLKYHSVKFRYVYVDLLNADMKQNLKNALADRYKERLVFPFIVIDGDKYCTGFVEEQWNRMLSL